MKNTKKLGKLFSLYDTNPNAALEGLKGISDLAKTVYDACADIKECLQKSFKRNSENIDKCYANLDYMQTVAQQELGKDIPFEQKVFWFKQMKWVYEESINLYRIEKRDNRKFIWGFIATSILSIGLSALFMSLAGVVNIPSVNNAT